MSVDVCKILIGMTMPNKLYIVVILAVVVACDYLILSHQQGCTRDSETEFVKNLALTTNTVRCGSEEYQELLINGKYSGKAI